MKTGNCNYESGAVNSAFDCGCDECKTSVQLYEQYMNDQAAQDEFNSIISSQGVCDD